MNTKLESKAGKGFKTYSYDEHKKLKLVVERMREVRSGTTEGDLYGVTLRERVEIWYRGRNLFATFEGDADACNAYVEGYITAATREAERPDPCGEAFNSGDGTYRP